MTYLEDLETNEAGEDALNAISDKNELSTPCREELSRLGEVFCRKDYYKTYRVMSLEQLDASTAYFKSFKLTEEELEDEENEKVEKIFISAENAIGGMYTASGTYTNILSSNSKFVEDFKIWLFTNGYEVELNCGMCHWITCLIESYSAG